MSHKKLYIIGNGFDLHHKILSEYKHFKCYLKTEDNRLANLVDDYIPVDLDEETAWSNLESALAKIDIYHVVDSNSIFLQSYSAEYWRESDNHDFQYNISEIVNSLSTTLKNQFTNWVRQIEIPDATSALNQLSTLDIDALYLTFNYTSTLTSVYSVPATNILHIHGEATSDTDIVLGHAWNPIERQSLNDHSDIEDQDTRVTEAYDILDQYFSKTFKPSMKIIKKNDIFFSRLRNIKEICVLGHSLDEVDRNYFKAVVTAINVDSTPWTIACRKPTEMQDKRLKVRGFGVSDSLITTVLWDTL